MTDTNFEPIVEVLNEKNPLTIQSSLSHRLDEIQESYTGNFDLFPNFQS